MCGEGFHADASENLAAVMRDELGDGYDVYSFGISGAARFYFGGPQGLAWSMATGLNGSAFATGIPVPVSLGQGSVRHSQDVLDH